MGNGTDSHALEVRGTIVKRLFYCAPNAVKSTRLMLS